MTELHYYLRHAQLYGAECVYETAATHLPAGELALLRVELDRIDAHQPRGRFASKTRKRRRSREETLAAAVALREQGLVIGAIADKLAITCKVAKELLATHRRRQRAARSEQVPLPPRRAVGCRRCRWWQDDLASLEAANDALAAHRCREQRPDQVLGVDSQPPETAWLSGENTSKTRTATDSPQERIQKQSAQARDQAEAVTRTAPGEQPSLSRHISASAPRNWHDR
jgi:hypothetical protein